MHLIQLRVGREHGAAGAQFAPVNGIHFRPNVRYPDVWPNAQPTAVPESDGMRYSGTNSNRDPDSETTVYKYNVTVVFDGATYTWDPEEENEGKGN